MKKEDFFEAIGDIDDDLIEEAMHYRKKTFPWKKFLAAAACLTLILTTVIAVLPQMRDDAAEETVRDKDDYTYSENQSKTGQLAEIVEIDSDDLKKREEFLYSSNDLLSLTEKELFAGPSDIFRGEVVDLKYYRVDYDGMICDYTVAAIRAEEIFRGDLAVGDVAYVRIRGIFNPGVWVEDSDTVSAMNEGVTGIFMVNDFLGEIMNDTFFDGGGVITHYFSDGERFAFLETEKGLVFAEWAYPSLKNAKTMEDIESFVKMMAQRLWK